MTKLPYGFDARMPYLNDDGLHHCSTEKEAWIRLEDVQTYLAKQEPLPPELAFWLGEAIRHSNKNSDKFMQRLGLKLRAGEKSRYSRRFKEYWQWKLWQLGTYNDANKSMEQIVLAVKAEMKGEGIIEENIPDRQTLQDWFNEAMTGGKRIR